MIADRMKNIYKLWDRKDVNPNLWNENKLPFSFLGIPANKTTEIMFQKWFDFHWYTKIQKAQLHCVDIYWWIVTLLDP